MKLIACVTVVVVCLSLMIPLTEDVYAEQLADSFSLNLTDNNGNDLTDPLFGGDVTVYFDTHNNQHGTVYKLKAMVSIRVIPANIVIKATGGQFKLGVSASGMDSFLAETGMRITITSDDSTYTADLKGVNNYSDQFKNSENSVKLDPNVNYTVDICLIDGYESTVPPESVSNIKITFQATAADGFHQVVFISQDETVESYVAMDNQVIEKTPSVSRSGHTLKGWFTPDGREITDGYVISPDEGDIIAYAEWEKNDSNNTIIYLAAGGGVGLLAAGLLLFLLKRRNSGESN